MKYTTRFSPTVNGNLHIGHIFMALVNEYEAHHSGGKFTVRFDDDQKYWNEIKHVDTKEIETGIKNDFMWLGIKVDEWESEKLMKHNRALISGSKIPPEMAEYPDIPEVVGWTAATYPYAPNLTALKVLLDYVDGVNLLIRGIDLITEFSLYEHYIEEFELPFPRHVYLPRLTLGGNGEISDISKTAGNNSIKQLREYGITPLQIIDSLKRSCLKDPEGDWSIDNVKANPVWFR